jgi:hypothetical protein
MVSQPADEIAREVARRRTFAIVSHPDAGKTTLTEKLLLFGGAIQTAGAVRARKATRHAVSDWMAMERERGISVTTSVMSFEYPIPREDGSPDPDPVLAVIGLYGVVAHSVGQRTTEIGIRIALGAERREILRLVTTPAIGVSAAGLGAGVLGSLTLPRLLAPDLWGVTPTDPVTLVTVLATVGVVVLAASWWPARRATVIDPAATLRAE